MQTWKRFLAALLALTMVTSYIPAPAYAEEIVEEVIEEAIFEEVVEEIEEEAVFEEMIEEPDVEEIVEEEIVEEIDIVVTDTVQGAQVVKGDYGELINPNAWGYCGSSVTNVTWGVYPGGTLVISGEGAMDDFGLYEEAGWWNQYPISHVIVEEGVTSIGNWAFDSEYSWHTPLLETVELASSVTSIGIGAFENCVELSSINLDYVKYISTSAFEGCTALTEVALTSLTELDSEAFKGCTGLTDLTLPGTVGRTSYAVGNESFMNCTGLTSVTVQEGVKWLGERIFDGCTKLQSISLPASLLDIGQNAFDGCTRLKEVHIADLQSWCKMNLSGYFSNNSNELANPLYYGADLYVGGQLLDNLVIPEGTDVQNSMNNFVGCGSIRSVTFPALEGKYINWIIRNCSGIQHIYFQGSAPQGFTSDAFTGITATAYYPATDESWTSDKFGNYGGSITWEPVYGDEDYQITLNGATDVTGYNRSGTGWSYDPKTNVLTLDGDFSGTVDSAREDLTIVFDGSVITGSIEADGDLTLRGKTGRDADGLQITQGRIKVKQDLTIEDLSVSAYWEGKAVHAIEVTNALTIRNAEVLASNQVGTGNYYGIKTGTIHVEDGSYVHCRTAMSYGVGLYTTQSGSSFSSDCHVVSVERSLQGSMTVKGISLPEYGYFYDTYEKKASADCLLDGTLNIGYYAGLNHAAYVQDADGENHQLICDCGTELGEPVACSGENGICADCGEKYGVVDGTCGDNVTWELEKSTGVLTVSGEGPMYDYSYNGYSGKIVPWADWTDQITKVVVTSGVTSVGNYAFGQVSSSFKYTKLAEVVLADTVTAIGSGAFYALPELTSVDLSAVTELGDSAFGRCAKLESVTFCDELKEIPGSAFYSCRSMENVTLPAKLETIGEEAFYDCGLVNLVLPDTVTAIGLQGFACCDELETVTLPASLTTLGYGTFAACESLKEITFLGNAPADGELAFYEVTGATGYYPADAEGWDEAYFENLGGTINWVAYYPTSGKCGENLTWAFDEESGVLTISGSGAMEFTGGEAPWEHYKSQIKILNLDDDITTIADYAFNYYYITGELVLPSKLESIGDGAFSCCFEMTGELVLPDTLTHIGESAFGQCYEITGGVVIPEGVTEIPRYAFSFCAGLSSIEIPGTVTSIGEMAFAGDTLTIIFTGDAPNFDENALGEVHATAYYSADAEGWEEVVKNQYGAASLTWVPMNLTSGSCGEGVTWSMDQENNTLTISGEGDMTDFPSANAAPWYLNYNDTITAVVIEDGVTSVGDYAFGGNSSDYENLVSVTLGDTLERIGKYAFGSCAALTQINLPDSLISIGYYAFSNCTGLTEITLPDSVTELGWGALRGCTGLTAVTLSENLETIGGSAFSNTTGLTTITIPASVTLIERAAFQGTGAGEIIFTGPAPTFGTNPAVFYGITATAYYPADDATWTEAVRTSCGGNITWVAMEPTSGSCGENVTWSFDEDTGVLTISGTGAMDGYYGSTQPWLVWAADITKVVVTDGITSVGEYAFRDSNGASYAKLTTVELADTVTTIGSNAFEGLRELTAIDLSSVTELGMYAFDHCAKLETVIFSDDLKEIPVDAFDSCSSLKNVRLPAKLERIGQQAFAYCGNAFVDLVVPEGVSAIDFAAFGGCTSLQTLTLPENLTAIGDSAFALCTNLKTITFQGDAPEIHAYAFTSVNGATAYYPVDAEGWENVIGNNYGGTITWVPLEKIIASGMCGDYVHWKLDDQGTLTIYGSGDMRYESVPWANYRNQIKMLVVESGVANLAYNAFADCLRLESVVLPEGLTRIESQVFDRCSGLKSASLPSTLTEIGFGAFRECSALTTITLPAGLTMLGGCAFESCTNLTGTLEIPSGIKTIDQCTFYECKKLEQIVLPEGLQSIGTSVFVNCTNLRSINIPSGVAEIREFTFQGCSSLESLVLPDDLLQIGMCAFNGCEKLESINIPATVRSIDAYAFQNCTALSGTIEIPSGITEIKEQTFWNCASVESVIIPDSVTTIGNTAFSGCTSLKSITIPSSVTSIGSGVFSGCTALERVDMLGSMTTIEHSLFLGCSSLTSVNLPAGLTRIGDDVFEGCEKLESITIPSGVTEIGAHAFSWCTGLTGITIPSGVKKIEDGTFNSCKSLEKLVIPAGVTSIGYYAFSHCTGLQEITFQGEAPSFDECAFVGTNTTAYYPGDDATWTENVRQNYGGGITWVPLEKIVAEGQCGEDVYWKLNEEGTLTIYGKGAMSDYLNNEKAPWYDKRGQIKTLVVEDGVTCVGYNAFRDCILLTSVSLPEGLLEIANNAFNNCIGLTSVDLPDSVTNLEACAFYDCGKLAQVHLPADLTYLGNNVFQNCALTGTLTIPAGLTEIKNGTFYGCSGLTEIVFHDGVNSIGDRAFFGCSGLSSVTIPDSIVDLRSDVFYGCSGLTEVILSENLLTIGNNAFKNCSNLKNIEIPDSVVLVEDNVFYGCSALEELVLPNNLITIGDSTFFYCKNLKEIVIPANVTEIGLKAFAGCDNLDSVTFEGDAPVFQENVFQGTVTTAYYPGDNDTWTEEVRQGYGGNITWVPVGGVHTHVFNTDQQCDCGLYGGTCGEGVSWLLNKENGLLTISGDGIMEDFAYYYDWSWKAHKDAITTIVVEESVTAIGNYAFSGCKALTSVTMAETVTRIGESAFYDCTALTDITLHEGITELAQNCFEGCTGLTEITLPQSLTTLGIAAFGSCTGLTEVTIPGNVTAMYSNVFQFCSNLTTVTFAEGVTDTGDDTFYECDALTTVNLPQSLTRLGDSLFYSCDALKQVTVPAAVREVGEYAFYRCGNLESVTFEGNAPQFNESSFSGTETTVFYPCDDATWTRDVRQNYGGTITWKALYDHENGCGVDLTWAFDESTGKLTITGTGAMTDFAGTNEVPWYDLKDQIQIVEIADGVTTIGSFAFYGCNNILEVYLPEGLTTIGNYGLYYYNNSIGGKSLSIPATVTTLGSDSLWGGEITFLGTVPTTLGSRIMSTGTVWYDGDDTSWEEETVRDSFGSSVKWMPLLDRSGVCGDDLTWTLTKDGLLTVTGTGNMYETPNWSAYMDQIKKVVISEGVTYIGARAFQDAKNLTEAEIAGTVVTIGEDAFQGCKKLSSVTMEHGVKTIGIRAFNQCDALEEIFLPDSVAYIYSYAFAWNENLKEITMPMAISSISTGAFAGASALKSLTFLGGAPSLVKDAFDEDVTLTIYYPADDVSWTPYVGSNYDGNITWVAQKGDYIAQGMCGPEAYWKLDHESKLTVYGSGAMSDWSYYDSTGWINSYKTQITTLVVEDGITVLGQNRFSSLTNLKNVELADSITTIVGGTFTNCGFETLELPENLKDIGNYAFQNCAELTQIVLPDSLEYLGSYAFLNCGKLTDVTFGKNLKTIGGKAFSGCALLENVVWGSEILETIGDEAFRDCTKLTGDLIFPATLVSIGEYAFYGCAGLTGKVEIPSGTVGNIAFADLGITELVLGDNVTQIGNSAFANCTALTGTLTIPNSVTEIGNEAFICCTGYSGLQLGNSLRKIGRSTFSGCEKIRVKLTLPESLEEIGDYAFSDCKMIYGLTLNSGLKQLGEFAFSGCSGIRGELVIPAGVTEIQYAAFNGCSGLTKLTMHDDIRIIRDYAFDGCSNLSGELKLPENLESIGLQAFYGCTKLNGDLIIPSGVKTINDNAFGETGVTSLQFGSDGNSSLETIGSWAFYDTALTGSLQIPDSVKTIGNYAFQGCSGLTELKLGSGVETIEDGAFVGCGNLTGTLVVPDSIVTIGAEAFGWTGFSKAILGKDLWEIGTTANTSPQSNAFVGCGNLEQIIFTGVEFYPFINSGFEQVTGLKTILVPEDARTDYEIEIGERMPVGASIVGYRAMIGYDCYENLTAALNSASSEDVITMMSDDLTPTFVNQEVTIDKNGFAINAHPGKSYDEKPGETEGTVTFFAVSAQLNDAQKYITLQEAVNAAKTGDTITLLAGDQTAHVENKELTILKGEFTATITAGEGYKVEPTDTGYVVKKGANAPEFEYSMQASLNLESEVSMNVGFKFTNQSTMDDAERADVMGRVGLLIWDSGTIEEENATYENHSRVVFDIENVSYNSEKDRFEIRTEGIAAKRLGDSIDFRAFYRCEDGTYVYSRLIKNYSPKKYCYNRMGSGDQNEVNLMVAILNYGAAAQIYFGHHTDALMNADLTEEQKQMKWDGSLVRSDWNVPDEKAGKFVRSPEIISRGANLTLEGAIDNTFYAKADGSVHVAKAELLYWKEADYHNISVLTEDNVSGVIAMEYVEATGRYEGTYSKMAAKEIFSAIYACAVITDVDGNTYYSGVVAYSPERFGYINQSKPDVALANLAKNVVIYGDAARTFFYG